MEFSKHAEIDEAVRKPYLEEVVDCGPELPLDLITQQPLHPGTESKL